MRQSKLPATRNGRLRRQNDWGGGHLAHRLLWDLNRLEKGSGCSRPQDGLQLPYAQGAIDSCFRERPRWLFMYQKPCSDPARDCRISKHLELSFGGQQSAGRRRASDIARHRSRAQATRRGQEISTNETGSASRRNNRTCWLQSQNASRRRIDPDRISCWSRLGG